MSSQTMNGALPPSSSDMRLTLDELWRISSLPTRVEPVNEMLRMRLSLHSTSDTVAGSPVTTLNTPAGMPARSASSASASAEYGVSLAGLTMTGQPAASAAPALRVIIASGKFQGVNIAETPTGSLIVPSAALGIWLGMVTP